MNPVNQGGKYTKTRLHTHNIFGILGRKSVLLIRGAHENMWGMLVWKYVVACKLKFTRTVIQLFSIPKYKVSKECSVREWLF